MRHQNGSCFEGRAARSGAPQTRAEVERMFELTGSTDIVIFTRRWLALDDERAQIEQQIRHVGSVLGDRILASMLDEQLLDIVGTMRRRAEDLSRLPSAQIQDIGCKCYVRKRILEIAPEDETTPARLCDSLRTDLKRLDIDIEELTRRTA